MSRLKEKFDSEVCDEKKEVIYSVADSKEEITAGRYQALLIDAIIQPGLQSRYGLSTKITLKFLLEHDGEKKYVSESFWHGKTERSKFFRMVNPMIQENPLIEFDPNEVIGEIFEIEISINNAGDESYVNVDEVKSINKDTNN